MEDYKLLWLDSSADSLFLPPVVTWSILRLYFGCLGALNALLDEKAHKIWFEKELGTPTILEN